MKKITFLFCIYSFFIASAQPAHNKKVIGYYAQWAIYARDYNVWDVDASKLTHLMYSFFDTEYDPLHPENTKLKSLDPYADFEHNEGSHSWDAPYKGNFADLRDLKLSYPHLKIIISIGGWTRSQNFPAIAASSVARDALAVDMANMITQYPWIDGFDIDWEFPLYGGTDGTELLGGSIVPAQPHTTEDNKNLVYLLKAMRQAMPTKSISIAAGNNVTYASEQFIGPNNKANFGMTESITDFCDFITCFGYDFGGNWNDKTCYNAPLYGSGNINDPLYSSDPKKVQSLENLVAIYLNDVGIPSSKFVMGLPMYGKLFENVATTYPIPELPGLFANAPRVTGTCSNPQPPQGTWDATTCEFSGSIEFCDYAGSSGTSSHHLLDPANPSQLKPSSISAGWVKYWDNTAKVPYLYNATTHQFLMYDDEQSIDEKVKFILSKNLAGGMIWELSQDSRSTDPVPNRLLKQINSSFSTSPSDLTITFKDTNNTTISGVNVTLTKLSDNSTLTYVSDANGTVSFLDQQSNVAYAVTYTKSGFAFLPETLTISSLSDNPIFNVVGSDQVVSISGFVKTSNLDLIPNVVVKLLNSSSEVLASQTSTDGNFNFQNIISGLNYKVTAEKQYYNFNEFSLDNVTANRTGVEVAGSMAAYTISGTVKDGNTPIVGATVTASFNSTSLTSTTNSLGEYSFADLTPGITYALTTSNTNQTFLPASAVFSNLGANQTQNFILNSYLLSGVVKNGTIPVSGAKVQLTLPWTDGLHGYQSIIATTDADGKYFFDNSVLSGYTDFQSIVMNAWENNSTTYYPNYSGSAIPSVPQTFNFNTQQQAVDLSFTNPLGASISIAPGSSIDLVSTASMLFQDGTTISSVVYTINGQNYTANNTSGSNYSYAWTPAPDLFNTDIQVTALSTGSNGMTATTSVTFHLNCTGSGCPNQAPIIVWSLPSQSTINQASGFLPVHIEVTATDNDGSIASVSININGTLQNMISAGNNTYTFSFTPSAYQEYPVLIKATDNLGLETLLNKNIKIINSIFVPLPEKVIVGYAHSWENSNAPFLYFNQMGSNKYNVVVYSFIETLNSDGFTPQLTVNSNRYLTNGVFDPQLLKDDIAYLRNQGIPVLVSIGGQNGHVSLETITQKNTFIQGIKSIIDQYQFDGLDLDFEGGSMSFGAGALTDFSYTGISAYPKLKNLVDAVKELKTFYGSGFHITAAPETFYVQVGYSSYTNVTGAFLPVINNIRDELDLLMVQLYNTGSINALNGTAYSQATPDFLVSMTDMLIKGFNVASTGYHFDGLPASKIVVGIPACSSAAPAGGYIIPTETIKALNYLRFGTDYSGRNYTLQAGGPYPDLRGVMTWSINWDAAANCASAYEFSNAYSAYFGSDLGNNYSELNHNEIIIYESKGIIHINTGDITMENVLIFDLKGALLEERTNLNTSEVKIMTKETDCVLIVKVVAKDGTKVTKKIIVQ